MLNALLQDALKDVRPISKLAASPLKYANKTFLKQNSKNSVL